MDWPHGDDLRFLIRHPTSWWIESPPCDLALFLDRAGGPDGDTSDDFRRILVLTEPGPYDSLVVHVADMLAMDQEGRITLFQPVLQDTSDEQVADHEAYQAQLARLCTSPVDREVVRVADINASTREVSRSHDLMILGASAERGWRTLFLGSRGGARGGGGGLLRAEGQGASPSRAQPPGLAR